MSRKLEVGNRYFFILIFMALKIIGVSYLEEHSGMQKKLEVPEDHVIVDRKDWEEVVHFLQEHSEVFNRIINRKSQITYGEERSDG